MKKLYILLVLILFQFDSLGQKYCHDVEWISLNEGQVEFRINSNGCVVVEYFGCGTIQYFKDDYIVIKTNSKPIPIDQEKAISSRNSSMNVYDIKVNNLDDLIAGQEITGKYVVLKYDVLTNSRFYFYLLDIIPTTEKINWRKIRKRCNKKEGCQEIYLRTMYKCDS
jgi:hypothetical protein